MNWRDLEIYLQAVRTGSYTAAGRALGLNRTTVGRRVEALEAAVGVPLFDQTPHGYRPTPAGERLLAAAEAAEREVSAMLNDLAAPLCTIAPVRIAASGGLGVEFLPELARFRQAHPEIVLELLDDLDPMEAVTQRRADLGLALVKAVPQRLRGEQIAVLRQARYRRKGCCDLPMLGWGYSFDAALPSGPSGGPWASNPAGEAAQLAGLVTLNSWAHMKQAVMAGLGSANLWCFAADAEPLMEQIAPPDPRFDCPLWLVRRSKAPPSAQLLQVIDFLRSALVERCGAQSGAAAP
jgi:DNA-binding transcriptional LysR family regulator